MSDSFAKAGLNDYKLYGHRTEGAFDEWAPRLFEELGQLLPRPVGKLEDANALPNPRIRIRLLDAEGAVSGYNAASGEPSRLTIDMAPARREATVKVNRRMTAEDWYQDVRHIELTLEKQIKYVETTSLISLDSDILSGTSVTGRATSPSSTLKQQKPMSPTSFKSSICKILRTG